MINISSYEKCSENSNLFYSIKNFINSLIDNNSSKEYIYAFVLGDMRYVDSDIKDIYQSLGISHLFSVSGMHISILSSVIIFILKKLKIEEELLKKLSIADKKAIFKLAGFDFEKYRQLLSNKPNGIYILGIALNLTLESAQLTALSDVCQLTPDFQWFYKPHPNKLFMF